ncbi:hypothetical protein SCP_0207580 [Sparassis crispa]|uniref:Uncharacterized protein n=1 Tax=Sparassis crispa TaxID=139825 RepID=A0A401GBK7_9APHY|nr:hypothetical protein SCP_0207580 [Sparassis crispa]GBE79558.1 hypothetical protein SCP_0207580 [Sparassis crispa]
MYQPAQLPLLDWFIPAVFDFTSLRLAISFLSPLVQISNKDESSGLRRQAHTPGFVVPPIYHVTIS